MKKLFILLLIVTGCSGKNEILSSHEKLFYNVVDSLKVYENEIKKLKGSWNQETADFVSLEFEVFRKKYKLSDLEMDQLSNTYKTTYEVARTFINIEENMSKIKDLDKSLKEMSDNTKSSNSDYSFDPSNPILDTNSIDVKVLMNAYDSDVKKSK